MAGEISIVRGTTNAFGVTVTDETGKEYTLEEGQTLVFGLKHSEMDENRVLVKKIQKTASGEHYLELMPEDTIHLEPGTYYYDIGLQHGLSVFHNVVEPTKFFITPNVTQLGDGT